MINLDDGIKENIKKYNPNCSQFSDYPYKILRRLWTWKNKFII